MKNTSNHQWKFFRAGGFDQVKITCGADIANLDQLDQKLWVALACPTGGLEFDAKTLALIDTDKDGRVRAPELIAAAKWATGLLKNPDSLLKSSAELPIDAINDAVPEGKAIAASARQILINLGRKDATAISIDDTTDTVKIFAQTHFNGDGIVPADASEDEALRTVINEIITCLGSETDRSGKPGITQARADQFFAECQAFSDWWKKTESEKDIMPLGEATAAAAAAVKAVKVKVDDYFARCRLAVFDSRAIAALNRQETEYLTFAAKDLTISAAEVAGFPLARIEANKPLPLEGVNPAWAGAVAKLRTDAIKPLLGDKASLTEADWTTVQAKLGAFECWSVGKVGTIVEPLGLKRVREILGGKAKEAIAALIAKDKALEPEANAISNVDKLVRYHRDLYLLCKNFVNFRDFYDAGDAAIFQAGVLYLDQRSCELTLPVEDAARHASLAGLAGTYLAYCDCVRKGSGQKRQIVAAFTDGDSDNLMIGRNGIFYDRKGVDWDATITKIVDNPISVRQAFWSPYKKFVRMIEEQAAKRAAAADAASSAKLAKAAEATANADKAGAPPKKVDVGTVAALGVAITGAISALTLILGYVFKLAWWQYPLVFIGIMLVISGPSMVIAWLKLRKRNLGPILDANGWAVNAKAKINVPFGRSLTQVAKRPPGSQLDSTDPFAEKQQPWKLYLFLVIVLGLALGWYLGRLDKYLPGPAKSTTVMGTNAPAWKPEPAPATPAPEAATNAAPAAAAPAQ